jgi:hypothetical protein
MTAKPFLFIAALALLASPPLTSAQAETADTRFGKLEFQNGYPTEATTKRLFDEMDFQRAVQAYLWAVPAVSFESFRQGLKRDLGVDYNDIAIWDNFADPKGLLYTANSTTIYAVSNVDLGRDGPIVIEIPPGPTAGMIDDFWQRSATDVGNAGPDKGQGGKFLLLPPDYKGDIPAQGYHVVRATMSNNNFLIRGLIVNNDVKGAVDRVRQLRLYPWSERNSPKSNKFVSASGKVVDTLFPGDFAYWERLHSFINNNPVHERDRFFMAMLKPLGIEKGKPFNPDARQRAILSEAAKVGYAMGKAMLYEGDRRFDSVNMWKGTHWAWAVILEPTQEVENYSQLDERLHWFYGATYMTPAMALKKAGPGSQYIQTFKDKDGAWLDGANSYRLRVPVNAPAQDFWSLTVYDNETRSMLQNPKNDVTISSYDDLKKNADGSIDIVFAPNAPAGMEKNWIQTVPGKGFFVWFRAYHPTEPFFDKSWQLPDIVKGN